MLPDVDASKIAAATTVPHDPVAVGNSTLPELLAAVGDVPDTENVTAVRK
jgi:hypothetical protein